METREFLDELKRMMDSKGRTGGACEGVECNECPFDCAPECILGGVCNFETLHEAIEIVEEWSMEHPKKTNKEVLLKVFPNVKTGDRGTPKLCAMMLGIVDGCAGCCSECWNSEYNGERLRGDTK